MMKKWIAPYLFPDGCFRTVARVDYRFRRKGEQPAAYVLKQLLMVSARKIRPAYASCKEGITGEDDPIPSE